MERPHCDLPPALDDERLLALLDGVEDSEAEAHLDRCEGCRARLLAWSETEALLDSLYRVDCPPADTISALALGEVGWRERRRLTQHISRCPDCTEELTASHQFLLAEVAPQAPTVGIVQRVLSWLPASGPTPSAAWRAAPSSGPTVYHANDLTLRLSVAAIDRRDRFVRGQIHPAPSMPGEVRFGQLGDVDPRAVVPLATDGSFRAGPVPPGRYSLELQLGSELLVLDDIEV